MDWTDIEARLCEHAEEVCRYLLPNGKRLAGEYMVGSLAGEAGESLRINIAGHAGKWADFADSGKRGGKTLISLWCAVRHKPFRDCIREAKEFLGIRDDYERRIKPVEKKAAAGPEESTWKAVQETWANCQPLTEGGPVWNYLVNVRRIEPAVLQWLDIREMISRNAWIMVFPYYPQPPDEDFVPLAGPVQPEWLKFEALDRPHGKKREWTTRSPKKSLFGAQLFGHPEFKEVKDLLICEGEKDAMSWTTYGAQTWGVLPVSVPFGAKWRGQDKTRPSPNREWLDLHWHWLQQFETVFVAMDSDEPGKQAAADIIAEIGPRRCRLVRLPEGCKDANECLKAGIPADTMHACLTEAIDFAPSKVRSVAEYYEEFMAEWFDQEFEPGLTLPWEFPFKVRPSELTVWTGIEKSGKTTLLGFVLACLMSQGERALVASFEVRPRKTLRKFSRQVWGGLPKDHRIIEKLKKEGDEAGLEQYLQVARANATAAFNWMAKRMWIYDHTGIGQWQTLVDDMRWARRRYGITQFVIDNFMRLGIVKDDYAQQAEAITKFTALAMDLGVHIHLVVHQNKNEERGKRAVSGAFEIIANAHNILEVQRDEQKGAKVSELFQKRGTGMVGELDFDKQMAALDKTPDGKLILHAQRDGEHQNASKYLWFMWEGQQYADQPKGHANHQPIRFLSEEDERQTDLPTSEPE